jgi:5-carboxymethyl-2-hydroxymuconate isomerase
MNYTEHIRELDGRTPGRPVIFMKPATSIVLPGRKMKFPEHGNDLHFETELVLLIGREGYVKSESEAPQFISGFSVGFDLTLRDLQKDLKKDGLPWEIAKAFDTSAPVGNFVEYDNKIDIHNIEFSGFVNGELRQKGNSSQMIFPVEKLIYSIGSIFPATWFLPEHHPV